MGCIWLISDKTVFGMNINLLEDNPSWWWYLPLLGAILALTLVGWLLFKYNPVRLFINDNSYVLCAMLIPEYRRSRPVSIGGLRQCLKTGGPRIKSE